MHFSFSQDDILWTLTFAAMLVLLVVLLGRDRARRFPWFTTSIVLMAVGKLAARLLYHRLARIVSAEIFLPLADLSAIVFLLVVIEIARRAFQGAARKIWISAAIVFIAVGGAVLYFWGQWPAFRALLTGSLISNLRLMDLFTEKADLLANVWMILAGLLVVLFGRHYKAGWHSHTQQIAIGLTMASVSRLTIRGASQHIVTTANAAAVHTPDEYNRVMGLLRSFQTAEAIIFLLVLVWWIACLWIDEPGAENREQEIGNRE
ncbi:MAG: hypothetical protein WBP85_09190 [Terracidiphilus sp.]